METYNHVCCCKYCNSQNIYDQNIWIKFSTKSIYNDITQQYSHHAHIVNLDDKMFTNR